MLAKFQCLDVAVVANICGGLDHGLWNSGGDICLHFYVHSDVCSTIWNIIAAAVAGVVEQKLKYFCV